MARLWCLRIAGTLAALALAFLFVSLDPFLGSAQVGSGFGHQTPAVSVNRFRKGDRLPLYRPGAEWRAPSAPKDVQIGKDLQIGKKVPFGCDPAFAPFAPPPLSQVYGRCLA
jgi:hypothetical protein